MKMYKHSIILSLCCIGLSLFLFACNKAEDVSDGIEKAPSKLVVISSCGDREVALTMVYPYTHNSKINGWWDEVEFILWGQSAIKVVDDKEQQDYIRKMKEAGIALTASQASADFYGIAEKLTDIGFTVQTLGERLTELLKDDTVRVITF